VFIIFVEGLLAGIWFLGAMLPGLVFLLGVGWVVYRFVLEDEPTIEDFIEDFPPEIPTRDEPGYRNVPSTIVRPPKIMKRKGDDDDKT
jgi:hypothetical protein